MTRDPKTDLRTAATGSDRRRPDPLAGLAPPAPPPALRAAVLDAARRRPAESVSRPRPLRWHLAWAAAALLLIALHLHLPEAAPTPASTASAGAEEIGTEIDRALVLAGTGSLPVQFAEPGLWSGGGGGGGGPADDPRWRVELRKEGVL